LTGRDLGECRRRRRRRVTICVDPEGGPVVQEEMVEYERLQDWDAAASLHVEQRDAIVELRQQHLVRSRIGLVSKGPIAVSAPCRLVYCQSGRFRCRILGHTQIDVHIRDKSRRVASALQETNEIDIRLYFVIEFLRKLGRFQEDFLNVRDACR